MSQKWTREMVSKKSEEAVSANGLVGIYADMLGIEAKGDNDWIKAGRGDDRVYASTAQTLGDALAAGRSNWLLNGGYVNDPVFGEDRSELFGGKSEISIQLEIGGRTSAANEQITEAA